MERIDFRNAYYIKLGSAGGWEEGCIKEGKARIGFKEIDIKDINAGRWNKIVQQSRQIWGDKGVGTRDANALRVFAESTSEDIWITFHASKMWWCRLEDRVMMNDRISKHRKVVGKWHDENIRGKKLLVYDIPGSLSKVRAFRATVCRVDQAFELKRVINDEQSAEYHDVLLAKEALARRIESAVTKLHWKDFEILVDLLFSRSNLKRTGGIGKAKEYSDIELEDQITGDRYLVQVKSQATLKDFRDYAEKFPSDQFRRLYFIVHSPDKSLLAYNEDEFDGVEIILPERISAMTIDCGLVNWILDKVR